MTSFKVQHFKLFLPSCSVTTKDLASQLKGNPTNFTCKSVLIGLGEYYCICGKSSVKPSVAQEKAACNLIAIPQ